MKTPHNQQGIALLIMIFILVLATLAYTVRSLSPSSLVNSSNKETARALSEAKTALIGYAVLHGAKPGTLPCPDTDNNGTANPSGNICTSYIGRLPWKTLGSAMLKDANNECLWYSLSPVFRNPMPLGPALSEDRTESPLNGNTVGSTSVVNDNNAAVETNPIVAVVIAPNYPVAGQVRSGAATAFCLGDSIAAKYLDTKGAVNNATGNRPPLIGVNYAFKKGSKNTTFNDNIIYITANEFFPILRKRIAKEIVGDVDVPSGLFKRYQDMPMPKSYPCPAATFNGNEDCSPPAPMVGFVPYNDATVDLQYTTLGNWLINNGWFPMTSYNYISTTHVAVTVTDPFGSYTCDVNMNVVDCA